MWLGFTMRQRLLLCLWLRLHPHVLSGRNHTCLPPSEYDEASSACRCSVATTPYALGNCMRKIVNECQIEGIARSHRAGGPVTEMYGLQATDQGMRTSAASGVGLGWDDHDGQGWDLCASMRYWASRHSKPLVARPLRQRWCCSFVYMRVGNMA